ncbi:SAM-dependent methyltransferase [Acuticoccus sediminis]|uniref:SAM-dependent methyltransferase n=1 Tax=Acuticoccus sediminis TaxID=2184697 RepID=A0A8B2NMJ6_9HYPH|nr:class I SAM-dependent methyltransferase [Acuticoccus sediminis]RAH99840.1 SAM-dependent methyltransferase [Acuticoccus sediminis]
MDQESLSKLKTALHFVWNSGDYETVARTLEPGAAAFFDRLAVGPGDRILDVACGTGQIALPAARAGAKVTGLDLSENNIEKANALVHAGGLEVKLDAGDVEDMPYKDETFDLTVSLIGAMFAPRPERAAAEMLRVTRPGGRLVMGNWADGGFIASFFAALAKYAPMPDIPSPLLWGDEATVRDRFAKGVASLALSRHPYRIEYGTPVPETVEHYFNDFGPSMVAVADLDPDDREDLREDLEALFTRHNIGTAEAVVIEAELLDVVAVRA